MGEPIGKYDGKPIHQAEAGETPDAAARRCFGEDYTTCTYPVGRVAVNGKWHPVYPDYDEGDIARMRAVVDAARDYQIAVGESPVEVTPKRERTARRLFDALKALDESEADHG